MMKRKSKVFKVCQTCKPRLTHTNYNNNINTFMLHKTENYFHRNIGFQSYVGTIFFCFDSCIGTQLSFETHILTNHFHMFVCVMGNIKVTSCISHVKTNHKNIYKDDFHEFIYLSFSIVFLQFVYPPLNPFLVHVTR